MFHTDTTYANSSTLLDESGSSALGYGDTDQRPASYAYSINGEYTDWTPQTSMAHDFHPTSYVSPDQDIYVNPGPSHITRNTSDMLHALTNYDPEDPGEIDDAEIQDDYWEDDDDDDESRFINFSLLSHMAVQLRDKVPRGTHVKGSIPYHRAFTGKDVVVRLMT